MQPSLNCLILTEPEREIARRAIQEMAYFKWLEAGCPDDGTLKFWLDAEKEWVEYCYVPDRYPPEKPSPEQPSPEQTKAGSTVKR